VDSLAMGHCGHFGARATQVLEKYNGTYDSVDFLRYAMYNSALKLKILNK